MSDCGGSTDAPAVRIAIFLRWSTTCSNVSLAPAKADQCPNRRRFTSQTHTLSIGSGGNSWSKAAAPIWALVCGLPTPKRQRRVLVMLQAYFDDSRMDPGEQSEGAFVLAGYIAEAAQWAAFADAWQAVLDLPSPRGLPPIGALKTKDAFQLRNRKSRFFGWTEAERDERLLRFAKVANSHAIRSIQCLIPTKDFKQILGVIEPVRPYWLAFHSLIGALAKFAAERGPEEQVEIYFDIQGDESEDRLRASFRQVIAQIRPDLAKRIAGEPCFKDDEVVLPLQAADLIAWHMRRNIYEAVKGGVLSSVVWTELMDIERLTGLFDREKLIDIARRYFDLGRLSVPGRPMTLPDPSSGWGRPS